MKLGIRELLFVAVMLALLGGTYFVILKPAGEKRAALKAETEKRQKELADLKMAGLRVNDFQKKTQELEEAIRFFEGKLPRQQEMDGILNRVTELVNKNGLHTKTVKTMKMAQNAGYNELPIQLSLSGDFKPGFYSFLLQLEKERRLTRITQMKLEKLTDRDGAATAQITLSVFFESEGSGAVAETH